MFPGPQQFTKTKANREAKKQTQMRKSREEESENTSQPRKKKETKALRSQCANGKKGNKEPQNIKEIPDQTTAPAIRI